jgi:hypothetical protein
MAEKLIILQSIKLIKQTSSPGNDASFAEKNLKTFPYNANTFLKKVFRKETLF